MRTVNAKVGFVGKADRLELFIRFLYSIPLAIVCMVLTLIAEVCWFFQFFHILVFAKRN